MPTAPQGLLTQAATTYGGLCDCPLACTVETAVEISEDLLPRGKFGRRRVQAVHDLKLVLANTEGEYILI
jgi:hypothetical protein